MVVGPLSTPFHASAHREHNIGSEKYLAASVVWKAHLSLLSAIRSFEMDNFEFNLTDLPGHIEWARRGREDVVRMVIDYLLVPLSFVYSYHPLVVLAAPLRIIRIIGKERSTRIEWWCIHRQINYGHSGW